MHVLLCLVAILIITNVNYIVEYSVLTIITLQSTLQSTTESITCHILSYINIAVRNWSNNASMIILSVTYSLRQVNNSCVYTHWTRAAALFNTWPV